MKIHVDVYRCCIGDRWVRGIRGVSDDESMRRWVTHHGIMFRGIMIQYPVLGIGSGSGRYKGIGAFVERQV